MNMKKIISLVMLLVWQSMYATTFTIVDELVPRSVGISKRISAIAPLYKDQEPVFYQAKPVQYTYYENSGKRQKWQMFTADAYGYQGTTPYGLTHLKGVAFELDGQRYKAYFEQGKEPSRVATNVLIKIVGKDGNYVLLMNPTGHIKHNNDFMRVYFVKEQ